MDHPNKITFWPITSNFIDGRLCSLARGTPYISRILRSIDKSSFYGHFKRIIVSPKKNQVRCILLTELIDQYIETFAFISNIIQF